MKLHWTKAVRRLLALAMAALLAAVPAMAAEDFRSAQAISNFSEGLAAFQDAGDLWGFIDKSGSVVVEPQYDDAVRFKDSLAAVEKDELKGYIDASGNVVIPLQYEVAGAFEQGRAWAKLDGEYRMIDKTGAEIGANRWDNVFSEFAFTDLCRVCRGGLWGYVNLNDEIVLNPVYEKATRFSDGLAAVKKDGVWYFIDEKGVDVLSGENTQA